MSMESKRALGLEHMDLEGKMVGGLPPHYGLHPGKQLHALGARGRRNLRPASSQAERRGDPFPWAVTQ